MPSLAPPSRCETAPHHQALTKASRYQKMLAPHTLLLLNRKCTGRVAVCCQLFSALHMRIFAGEQAADYLGAIKTAWTLDAAQNATNPNRGLYRLHVTIALGLLPLEGLVPLAPCFARLSLDCDK